MRNHQITTAGQARAIRLLLKVSEAYQMGLLFLFGTACVLFAASTIPAY